MVFMWHEIPLATVHSWKGDGLSPTGKHTSSFQLFSETCNLSWIWALQRNNEKGESKREQDRYLKQSIDKERERKKKVDYVINIARKCRWWMDNESILVNASMWCMSFRPEGFVYVAPNVCVCAWKRSSDSEGNLPQTLNSLWDPYRLSGCPRS
jgi:hypothetical protein